MRMKSPLGRALLDRLNPSRGSIVTLGRVIVDDLRRRPEALRNQAIRYVNDHFAALGLGAVPMRSIGQILGGGLGEIVFSDFVEAPPFTSGQTVVETGGVNALEAMCLVALLKSTPARTIVEFGTSYGDSALLFDLNSPADAVVLTTDWPERTEVGTKIFGRPKIRQFYARTDEWDLSDHAGAVDFLFIDASHSYEDVLADSHKALSLIGPGGVIAWHDYRFRFRNGVVRALDELSEAVELAHLQHTSLVVHRVG